MEKKATAFIPKGIPSIPPKPISDSSTHIEELARLVAYHWEKRNQQGWPIYL